MKIKIFVSHYNKEGYIYSDDNIVPIQVGKDRTKLDFGIISDNIKDNISEKNSGYAELTTQYWIWKNYDLKNIDYVGFCHYRRYFSFRFNTFNFLLNNNFLKKPLSIFNTNTFYTTFSKNLIKTNNENLVKKLNMKEFDICLPKKILSFSSIKDQCCYYFGEEIWEVMKRIILTKYPSYKNIFNKFEKQKKSYICNMFIMKKEYFIEYNKRLFDILFSLEKKVNEEGIKYIKKNESRVYGCLAERLQNLWLLKKIKDKEIKIIHSNFLFLINK